MKLTNNKTKKKLITNNKSLVARNIAVSRQTIYNWEKKGKTQYYYRWILEFD